MRGRTLNLCRLTAEASCLARAQRIQTRAARGLMHSLNAPSSSSPADRVVATPERFS